MDIWFQTGNISPPPSGRSHDLSDAIVITGLNNMSNKIEYDNSAICLNYDTKVNGNATVSGNITSDATITGNVVANNGASGTFISQDSKTVTVDNGIVTSIV